MVQLIEFQLNIPFCVHIRFGLDLAGQSMKDLPSVVYWVPKKTVLDVMAMQVSAIAPPRIRVPSCLRDVLFLPF